MLQKWESLSLQARKVWEAKEDREGRGRTWKEEVKRAYEARGENGKMQRQCAKTENSGNHYGKETYETTPHGYMDFRIK